MKEIKITEKLSGGRLDKLLLKYLNAAPKGFIYKMLRKKNIVLNDNKASGNEILKAEDSVKLYLSDETIEKFKCNTENKIPKTYGQYNPEEFKKLIAFEDENIIVLNKPSGLLTQKAKPQDFSLNDMLLSYLGKDELFTAGILNRLDRNTAGLVLAAKNPAATRNLSEALRERFLDKTYLALVLGMVNSAAYLKSYILKDEALNKSKIINIDFCRGHSPNIPEGAKLIKTSYKPLSSNEKFSLLEVDLITGRSHQIRAQLSAAGHPLAGDYKYGNRKINDELKEKYSLSAQFLCAYKINFVKMTGLLSYLNGMEIKADLPENYKKLLKAEGLLK